jgi:hypothetical protein
MENIVVNRGYEQKTENQSMLGPGDPPMAMLFSARYILPEDRQQQVAVHCETIQQ